MITQMNENREQRIDASDERTMFMKIYLSVLLAENTSGFAAIWEGSSDTFTASSPKESYSRYK